MDKVFISGSMGIKNLDKNVTSRIDNILNSNYEVIVGDAGGVDSSIQDYLNNRQSKSVVVYCSGEKPRNNLGHWTVMNIHSDARPNTRSFFTAKDLKMADDCDYGFMIWDTKSTGTLSNTIELLKRGKNSLVYINKAKEFLKIKNIEDFEILISYMSETTRLKADKKIGLMKIIDSLKNKQKSLF